MQFITTYLTANPDPQRGVKWESDPDELSILVDSVKGNIVIIHDEEFNIPNDWEGKASIGLSPSEYVIAPITVQVNPIGNPYFSRWEHILNNLPTSGFVCLLDATDAEMMNLPNGLNRYTLYVGHEQSVVGNQWMLDNFYTSYMKPFLDHYHDYQLLNCGVVIGHVGIIREFLESMIAESKNDVGVMEMGIFNKVMYEQFAGRFEYGNHVTTQFKKYETNNKTAWIRHK